MLLAIETSNPASRDQGSPPGVAIAHPDGTPVASRDLEPGARHDDGLMPAIDALCREYGVAPTDLTTVAVSVGPGGFTGLRVACATAQMLCLTTGAKAKAVPTPAVALASSNHHDGPTAVALASKRDATILTVFEPGDAHNASAVLPTVVTADTLPESVLKKNARVLSDAALPETITAKLEAAGAVLQPLKLDAAKLAQIAPRFPDVAPATLVPLYVREPEAVRVWRERRK